MPPHLFSVADNAYHDMLQSEYSYSMKQVQQMHVILWITVRKRSD